MSELKEDPELLASFQKLTPASDDSNYWLGGKSLSGDGGGVKVLEASGAGADALVEANVLKAGLHTLTLELDEVRIRGHSVARRALCGFDSVWEWHLCH